MPLIIETKIGFDEFVDSLKKDIESKDSQLSEVADVVKEGVERNLYQGLNADGTPAAPNKPSTIRRKGHPRVYFDKGNLFNSVRTRRISDKEYQVFISNDNNSSQVAYYLFVGRPDMIPRRPVGVGGQMIFDIDKKLESFTI